MYLLVSKHYKNHFTHLSYNAQIICISQHSICVTILMFFVMKLNNFITYFSKLRHQHLKVVYVTFRTKIDFHLHSRLSLSFPLAQFPAVRKSKRKGLTACTSQAATFSSILYYGKRCVGVDMQKMSIAFLHSIQLFHFQLFPPNECHAN